MPEPARDDRAGEMSTDQPDRTSSGVTGRIVHHVSRTKDRLDASSVGHVQRRFVQADLANQALILAALAFSLLVPVLVTVAALLPLGGTDSLPAAVAGRLGLTAGATADLERLFPTRDAVRGASTVIGTLFTLVSAYAWPTALQRGYEIAWGVSSRGWKGLWRPLVWLTGFVAAGALLMALPTSQALPPPWRTVLLLVLGTPVVLAWSWWTQHFLLRGAVGWRLLLPGALAMTIGLLVLRVVAGLYLSTAITSNFRHCGPLGIVFMLLTWLTAVSTVMLAGPVFGAALHERRMQTQQAATSTPATPAAALGAALQERRARAEQAARSTPAPPDAD